MSLSILVCVATIFLIIGATATIFSRLYDKKQTGHPGAPITNTYKSRSYLCSKNELRFYYALTKAFPSLTVMTKVRLADLITPIAQSKTSDFYSAFNSIRSKHIDFVICATNLKILFTVELDDRSHNKPHRISRDTFVDNVLTEAGIPIFRFISARQYSSDAIRERISKAKVTNDSGQSSGPRSASPTTAHAVIDQ